MRKPVRPEHQAVPMKGPYAIDGCFDAEVSVVILSTDGLQVCEIEPFLETWTAQEIANVHLLKASWALLQSAKALLGYTEEALRNAVARGAGDGQLKSYLLRHDPAAWEMIEEARRAILSAEGKAA